MVKVKKSTVDICEGGKIRTKHKSDVPQPLMLACGGERLVEQIQPHHVSTCRLRTLTLHARLPMEGGSGLLGRHRPGKN